MKLSSIVVLGLLLVVAFLVIYPIFMLLFGSFKGGPPGTGAAFSLQGYEKAYLSMDTYRALVTTFWLSAARAALAMALAIYLAWVVTRTDTPWRKGMKVLIWLKFFLPTLPLTVAWILLAGPKGFINQEIQPFSRGRTGIQHILLLGNHMGFHHILGGHAFYPHNPRFSRHGCSA